MYVRARKTGTRRLLITVLPTLYISHKEEKGLNEVDLNPPTINSQTFIYTLVANSIHNSLKTKFWRAVTEPDINVYSLSYL